MAKLTKHFIDNEVDSPSRGACFYPDSDVPGFWLRVLPHRKYFVVRSRLFGKTRTITIGACDTLSPDEARAIAVKILHAVETLPTHHSYTQTQNAITLGIAFEKYIDVRNLRPRTRKIYRDMMNRCLSDWQDVPVSQITKNMVEARHRGLCHTTQFGTEGKGQANLAMKLLRAVLNFAADYYETEDGQPLISVNPVRRLSQNKSWYRLAPRQTIVPDHKLADWYQAVVSLKNPTMSDYLLFLLLTGLRRTEAASLRWADLDFDARMIVINGKVAKNHREHRLPMSSFVEKLLQSRYTNFKQSEFVFPGRFEGSHITSFKDTIDEVRVRSNCRFVIHDLRRTFLSMAERLDVPHYTLKKLANHVAVNDVTGGYIVVDAERLRIHITRITDEFLKLLCPEIAE